MAGYLPSLAFIVSLSNAWHRDFYQIAATNRIIDLMQQEKKTTSFNWLAFHFSVQYPKVLENKCLFYIPFVRHYITGHFPILSFSLLNIEYACSINISSEHFFRLCCAISFHIRKPIWNNWQWRIYANSRLFHCHDEFSNLKSNRNIIIKNSGQTNAENEAFNEVLTVDPNEKCEMALFQFKFKYLWYLM